MYILNELIIKLCIFKYIHIISTWFYILLVLYVFIIVPKKVIWKLYRNSSFLAASQPLGYILANFYAIYLRITE